MIGYQHLPWVTKPTGVYLLLKDGKVVHAGKSKNLLGRLEIHRQWMLRFCAGRPTVYHDYPIAECPPIFDDVFFKLCSAEEMDAELQRVQKQFNIQPHTPAAKERFEKRSEEHT